MIMRSGRDGHFGLQPEVCYVPTAGTPASTSNYNCGSAGSTCVRRGWPRLATDVESTGHVHSRDSGVCGAWSLRMRSPGRLG